MTTQRPVKALVALLIALVCALTLSAQGSTGDSSTAAGTIISSHAEGTYLGEDGELINTISGTVTLIVAAVSGIAVTPDETTPSSTHTPQERITKVFRVCNTGNVADSFTITRAEINAPATLAALYLDLDGN